MRLYLFVFTVLALSCAAQSLVHAQTSAPFDCKEVSAKAEVTHTRDGGNNAQILLTFESPRQTDQYFIYMTCIGCGDLKRPVDLAFKNLRAGMYNIYIVGKDGCSKQLNIQVN